ncbi:unnamed protein product [Urochloa decumbens]|uniref:Uncharacterized protein n=1 Tax=Urochloa decumbens TaxID=240449 RepID=A0ABC8WDG8_9POAL
MESSSRKNLPPSGSQQPLHVAEADEEDESVKQLNECATIYLSLQALASPIPWAFSAYKSFVSFNTNLRAQFLISLFVFRTALLSPTATGRPAKHMFKP